MLMTDSFHIRSELLRRPFDPRVAFVAQATDISVTSVVDCEKGSVDLHIFLIRRIDGCTIRPSTVAGDGLLFMTVFVTVNGATFSLSLVMTGVSMLSMEQYARLLKMMALKRAGCHCPELRDSSL